MLGHVVKLPDVRSILSSIHVLDQSANFVFAIFLPILMMRHPSRAVIPQVQASEQTGAPLLFGLEISRLSFSFLRSSTSQVFCPSATCYYPLTLPLFSLLHLLSAQSTGYGEGRDPLLVDHEASYFIRSWLWKATPPKFSFSAFCGPEHEETFQPLVTGIAILSTTFRQASVHVVS